MKSLLCFGKGSWCNKLTQPGTWGFFPDFAGQNSLANNTKLNTPSRIETRISQVEDNFSLRLRDRCLCRPVIKFGRANATGRAVGGVGPPPESCGEAQHGHPAALGCRRSD